MPLTFGKDRRPPPGPKDPPPPPPPKALRVKELLQLLRGQLEDAHRSVLVAGEISNCTVHRSGHVYFTLKDADAQVRCALWRDTRYRIKFELKDGQQVNVRAKVTVFDRGDLHLSVNFMEPVGLGALQEEWAQRVEKLRAEGLTSPARKRPLPSFPTTIGIVSSKTGAALPDVLRCLFRRNPGQSVIFAATEVQGRGSANKVARAIEALDRIQRCEVILVVRGGGSLEDLWAFNEEVVARAIVACSVPVITGIGHETDTTIADLVADLRASTPTAAAEHAVPERRLLLDGLRGVEEQLKKALLQTFAEKRQRLLLAERHLRDPESALRGHAQRIDRLSLLAERKTRARLVTLRRRLQASIDRLSARRPDLILQRRGEALRRLETSRDRALDRLVAKKRHRLGILVSKLEPRSPLGVLARGYAVVEGPTGRVVRRADEVASGDRLKIRLGEGAIEATVDAPNP